MDLKFVLPMVVQQRRSVLLDLVLIGENDSTDRIAAPPDSRNTYIIDFRSIAGSGVSILDIPANAEIHSLMDDVECMGVADSNFEIEKDPSGDYVLSISRKSASTSTPPINNECPIDKDSFLRVERSPDSSVSLQLRYRSTLEDYGRSIVLRIRILEGDRIFECAVRFHLDSSVLCRTAVFDFGSEASQMTCLSFNGSVFDVMNFNLWDVIYGDYRSGQLIRKEAILAPENTEQFDKNDMGLYKSIWYVKKDSESEDESENIKLITDLVRDNDYVRMPNLKLTNFYNLTAGGFDTFNRAGSIRTFEDLKFPFYAGFIKKIISLSIPKLIQQDPLVGNTPRYLRLVMLVPNIYDYREFDWLTKCISLILDENMNVHDAIKGYEFEFISESDASFLGYQRMMDRSLENGYAVVVDCGKGTTDCSVVRVMPGGEFKSLFRTGVVGAGNLVTFSFFETFLRLIKEWRNGVSDEGAVNRLDVFFKRLLADDKLSGIYDYVEQWKTNHSGTSINKAEVLSKLEPFFGGIMDAETKYDELETILRMSLGQIQTLDDYYGYIDEALVYMTRPIADGLKSIVALMNADKIKFHGILFTGRGTRFLKFRGKMLAAILEKCGILGTVLEMMPGVNEKHICVRQTFPRRLITESDLICSWIEAPEEYGNKPVLKIGNWKWIDRVINIFWGSSESKYSNVNMGRGEIRETDIEKIRIRQGKYLHRMDTNITYPKQDSIVVAPSKNALYIIAKHKGKRMVKVLGGDRIFIEDQDRLEEAVRRSLFPKYFETKILRDETKF
jgi:hypothetical protein